MIPWWWLIIVSMLSGSGGLMLGAVCAAAGLADEKMEGMGKIDAETDEPNKVA
jgi:hypothetical protein